MVKTLMILACMYLFIMQDAYAMDEKGVVQCPVPTKKVSLVAWLLSPLWGQQEVTTEKNQDATDQNNTLDPMVAVPGRVIMPDDSMQQEQKRQDGKNEVKNRPPTPFYVYPGGPPMPPSPDPKENIARCLLKISDEWFPCGK